MRKRTIYSLHPILFVATVLACGLTARAQSAPDTEGVAGSREILVWSGGGGSVAGGEGHTSVANLGFRYGWVLSELHGPGFLRGRFEYAMDAVPIFLFFQPAGRAFGAGVDPVVVKWNFAPSIAVKPYGEITEGILFTNTTVPPGASHVNFQSGFALGVNIPYRRFHWSPEIRFMHISNAGIGRINPGINTVQGRITFGLFTRKK